MFYGNTMINGKWHTNPPPKAGSPPKYVTHYTDLKNPSDQAFADSLRAIMDKPIFVEGESEKTVEEISASY